MKKMFNSYEIKEGTKPDLFSIGVIGGKYDGVVFSYGTIRFEEKIEDDNVHLVFDYEIEDSRGFDSKLLEDDEDFNQVLGDILVSIIEDELESSKKSLQDIEDDDNIVIDDNI